MLEYQLVLCHAFFQQGTVKRFITYHSLTSIRGYHTQKIDYAQYIEYNMLEEMILDYKDAYEELLYTVIAAVDMLQETRQRIEEEGTEKTITILQTEKEDG